MIAKMKQHPKETITIAAAVVGLTVGLLLVLPSIFSGDGDLIDATRTGVFIDTETGEVFEKFRIPSGSTMPLKHPRTGEATLYPAEACYWTADGKAKVQPTYVLLNQYKGDDSPTICPDCGRRVVGRNPAPPDEIMLEALKAEAARRGIKP